MARRLAALGIDYAIFLVFAALLAGAALMAWFAAAGGVQQVDELQANLLG
ncbi:MAG: hypothetical protein LBR32_00375 [Propionibacteriaceae bacterium]|nr:hypothetical protein [Propionibacteriaceae bacterium]